MMEEDILAIIATITAAIKQNPLAEDVTIDGTRVSMPRANEKLKFWQGELARVRGQRPTLSKIDLRCDGC